MELEGARPAVSGSDTSVELQALGLSITRYIVPANLFASVVVSGTRLAITDYGDSVEYASSDIGYGMKALLGKGVAVELLRRPRHRCRAVLLGEPGRRTTLSTIGGGLVLSLTVR